MSDLIGLAFPRAATPVLWPMPMLSLQRKGPNYSFTSPSLTSRQQANVRMLLLSECLSFAGAMKSKLCKKTESHIQKTGGLGMTSTYFKQENDLSSRGGCYSAPARRCPSV